MQKDVALIYGQNFLTGYIEKPVHDFRPVLRPGMAPFGNQAGRI